MKPLLLTLLIIGALQGRGQTTNAVDAGWHPGDYKNYYLMENRMVKLPQSDSIKPKYDTIPVVLIVADTSISKISPWDGVTSTYLNETRLGVNTVQGVYWFKGYEVIQFHKATWEYTREGDIITQDSEDYWQHLKYLTYDKKDIPKNWLVKPF